MGPLSTVLFWTFAASMALAVLLMSRFVMVLRRSAAVDAVHLEDLSRLILSGSGGMRSELRGLRYVLRRDYRDLTDLSAVRAGDRVRIAWFATAVLLIAFGVSAMATK